VYFTCLIQKIKPFFLCILLFGIIYSNAQSIQSNTQSGCIPLLVRFSHTINSSNVKEWRWDLGDGNTSLQENPVYVYTTPGRFTIKLTITRQNGSIETYTRTNYILVGAIPVANFSVSATEVCNPDPVVFTDATNTNGTPLQNYFWDFGDGNTSFTTTPTISKSYFLLDTFNVFLRVTNIAGCTSTKTINKLLITKQKPIANISIQPFNNCNAPATIQLNNNSTGVPPLSSTWDVGDGTTYNTQNIPAHLYATNGVYSPKLTVTSSNGCTANTTLFNAIRLGGYTTSFTTVDSTCNNNTTLLENTSNPLPPQANWYINNVLVATGNAYDYTPNTTGIKKITLVNNFVGCIDSAQQTMVVRQDVPVPNFTVSRRRSVCAPFTTTFSPSFIVPMGATLKWNFGDGNTSTDANPTHTYQQFGEFDVSLTITNKEGCEKGVNQIRAIQIVDPTFSSFNTNRGCVPLTATVNISVVSMVRVAYYIFSFGDGRDSISFLPFFRTIYPNVGTFNATAIAVFEDSCRKNINSINPIVVTDKPTALFSVDVLQNCINQQFRFLNSSVGATNYNWLFFGRGSVASTNENPIISMPDTGYYSVRLVATKDGCSDILTVNNFIRTIPPLARYTTNSVCGSNNNFTRRFINQSIARPGTTYLWEFGDGNSSTDFSPTHTYANVGSYLVRLTAIGDSCSNTFGSNVLVTTNNFNVVASSNNICKGEPVTFEFTGKQANQTYNWVFTDGVRLNGNTVDDKVTRVFNNPGVYGVKVIVFDVRTFCLDTLDLPNFITVKGPPRPLLKIANTSPFNCLGLQVQLLADSSTAITNYRVNWGDGNIINYNTFKLNHTYTAVGVYNVRLTLEAEGCADSIFYPNFIQVNSIKANFSANATLSCPQAPIQLNASSFGGTAPIQYNWQLGDNLTATGAATTVRYNNTGSFTVVLKATDVNGCTDSIVRTNFINIVLPKASFTVNDSVIICSPASVQYTFTGANQTQVLWRFGDGGSSNVLNPLKTLSAPGFFTTRLTVTSPGGCIDTFSKTIEVVNPQPTYQVQNNEGCLALQTNFKHNSNGGDVYVWVFGDGYTDHTPQLSNKHLYERPGAFKPLLFVVDNTNCVAPVPVTDTVKVYGAFPMFLVMQNSQCDSALATVTATIDTFYSSIKFYYWNFGNNSFGSNATAFGKYTAAGKYNIQLITETAEGCKDTLQKNNIVVIDSSPTIQLQTPDTLCLGNTFTPVVNFANTNAGATYQWRFNNVVINNTATAPSITPTNIGNQSVQIIATNPLFGCADTATKATLVNPLPIVNFTNTPVCVGKSASFTDSSTSILNDIAQYQWRVNNQVVANTNTFTYLFSRAGTYTVSLRVTTAGGCTQSAQKIFTIALMQPKIIADTVTVRNAPVQMQVQTKGNIQSYNWLPAIELSYAAIANPIASITQSRSYTVIVTNTDGCVEMDSIFIKMYEGSYEIYVPSAFAPGGINRIFRPTPVGVVLKSFRVFDRYGKIIYESNNSNYRQGWNGNIQGLQQPAGTYVWMAEGINALGEPIVRKGTVVLIR
jgi:PKD repeat protein